MTTLEGNNLIAEFMGVKYYTGFDGGICETSEDGRVLWGFDRISWLDYDRDWNLLMPVAKKCNELTGTGINYSFDITEQWDIVVSFIQWHNSQPKTDNNDNATTGSY